MNYEKLLNQIEKETFSLYTFTLKGKLQWDPVSEFRQKKYFLKTGKNLTEQRKRYKIAEIFPQKFDKDNKDSNIRESHLLISEIEKDGIFYCVIDYRYGRMGERTRYKLMLNQNEHTNDKSFAYEVLEVKIIMRR